MRQLVVGGGQERGGEAVAGDRVGEDETRAHVGRGEVGQLRREERAGGLTGEQQVEPRVGVRPDAGLLQDGDDGGQPVDEVVVGEVGDLDAGRVVAQAAQQDGVVGSGPTGGP